MVDVDVAPWLASLPLAPVFHPSAEEFVDPIAYILKIEKEASQYGICKIIPPFSRAPENTVLSNLNASLAATQGSSSSAILPLSRSMGSAAVGEGDARVVMTHSVDSPAKFTTRKQQLGWNPRRPRSASQYRAQKSVWESGEYYTLEQFEDKAKSFSTALLGTCEDLLSPLVVETLFWNAEVAKPISLEYANDIPGSAFIEFHKSDLQTSDLSGLQLATSGWNIRNIARSHGSLLKFLPDEVPGVTTPMVYLGMLFSWFAWHVEDHELHSLNYLHTGARKTWYAVPADAAPALEEVIRLYGYGSRLKSRAAFTLLGEKTTILSPEILAAAGVPCCRLVQNPGEYVITFPRAYHLGFSHGFNCGEAANFATPAWLEVAREAAARRAFMNHLPMLSHEQLMYLCTLSLPKMVVSSTPQTDNGKASQVDDALKSAFVNEVKQNNVVLSKLLDFGVEACVYLKDLRSSCPALECGKEPVALQGKPQYPVAVPVSASSSRTNGSCTENRALLPGIARLPTPWGALPCAACGILCFASMALIQPTSAPGLGSRQRQPKACVNQSDAADTLCNQPDDTRPALPKKISQFSGLCQFNAADILPEMSSLSDDNMPDTESFAIARKSAVQEVLFTEVKRSSLDLLAETYKDDSEEECELCEFEARPDGIISKDEVGISTDAPWIAVRDDPSLADWDGKVLSKVVQTSAVDFKPLSEVFISKGLWQNDNGSSTADGNTPTVDTMDVGLPKEPANGFRAPVCSFNCESNTVFSNERDEDCSIDTTEKFQLCASNEVPFLELELDALKPTGSWSFLKGSARPYVFCLEHALEAVTDLQTVGGASVLVICHPNYDVIQQKAEDLAAEMKFSYTWDQIPLREASELQVEIINRSIHLKMDSALGVSWCARMGIGSRKLKKSSGSPSVDTRSEAENMDESAIGTGHSKFEAEKRMTLGRWCGKQWKASQVHPLLGGGKSTGHLLGQMVRRCEIQKRLLPMKIRCLEGPLKKSRKDGWDPQERVLTAAILRKSKRNAAGREGRRKRIKYDGIQARLQQTSSTLTQYGVCRQAVFALECSTNETVQDDQGEINNQEAQEQPEALFNPASSSTAGGCQRNSNFQCDLDSMALVKWHDVPVSCSPSLRPNMQAYTDWSSDRTAVCSTSQQDTAFDEMQVWDQVAAAPSDQAKKLSRLKRTYTDAQALEVSKRSRIQCVENSSDELNNNNNNNLIEYSPESYSELCQASAVDYACADGDIEQQAEAANDNNQQLDSDGAESGSDFDEYALRAGCGSGSDSSLPKTLPCFVASKKRSSSKSRVKRATWENLLNRLAPQKDEEHTLVNQDSFPLSCVTETGWDGFECGTYRTKRSDEETAGGGGGGGGGGGVKQKTVSRKGGKAGAATGDALEMDANHPFPCDIEGCTMSFNSEQELALHKKNKCTFKGCGKRFFSHKYLVQHRRVHLDARPLKCPWQGCTMSFKWAWARTEHIRVHTGERPYACPECDKTFRFVSDFSRHKRNTGHARA